MLEVVQDEQHVPLAQIRGQEIARGPSAHLVQTQRLGNSGDDESRLAERVEGNEPDPVREGTDQLGRDLESQPGLADPTRAGEGEQADIRAEQQTGNRGGFALAADEAGEWSWQI